MTNQLVTLAKDNRKELVRFLKFLVVGTLGTVIDFGVLNLLVMLFGFHKVLANACSFTAALISNFIWNRLWVYPEVRDKPFAPQFARFFIVNLAGLFINTAIFWGSDRWLLGEVGLLAAPMGALAGMIGMTHFSLAYNGAKAIATGVVLFWNFFINRIWTFKDVG